MVELKINPTEQLREKRNAGILDKELNNRRTVEARPFENKALSDDNIIWDWLRYKMRQPREWADTFDKKLDNSRIYRWATSGPSREVYRFTLIDGKNSHKQLVQELNRIQLETVGKHILGAVEQEVEKRNFSLTRKEASFLPVWVAGTRKPENPAADNFIGTLFYTTRGMWLFVVNQRNLRSIMDEEGGPTLPNGKERGEHFREMFPDGDLSDYESNGRPVFAPIDKRDFEQQVISYFKARLLRIYQKSGTKPIQDIKLVETNKKPV